MGRVGGGDVMTAFMYGLDQPQVRGQLTPVQVFGAAGDTAAFTSSLMTVRILFDMSAVPVFTTATPSCPTDTVMLVPSATSM